MRLGVIVLQVEPWSTLRDTFTVLDEAGADVAYVADHLSHRTLAGRWLADGWACLAAAATVTSRIDLGTLVGSAAIRTPVTLARAAATVDDVADGRLVLGLGAGTPHDVVVDGRPEPDPRALGRRYRETVEALARIFDGEEGWHGDEVGFGAAVTAPLAPARGRPHLMLAAHGARGLDLVARHGDGWSTYGGPASVTLGAEDYWRVLVEQNRALDQACETADRDPASVRRSLLLGFGTVRPLASHDAYRASVDRARDVGFDEVVVYWPDSDPASGFSSDPEVLLRGLSELGQPA